MYIGIAEMMHIGDDEPRGEDGGEESEFEGGAQDQGRDRGFRDAQASRKPRTVKECILDNIKSRARFGGDKLRTQLIGTIGIRLTDSGQKFRVDWTGANIESSEGDAEGVDCTISLTEKDFMKIAGGELNPQIAMLSHKIKVEGKSGLAIYFFNLIAPVQNQ